MGRARDEKWLILQPNLHKIANERKNEKKIRSDGL